MAAMTQRILPDRFHRHLDAIVLLYSFGCFGKRMFGAKIHQDSLQSLRVTSISYSRTAAEAT
jgi:hypothetical protein